MTKISALPTDTVPTLTDSIPTLDAETIVTKRITLAVLQTLMTPSGIVAPFAGFSAPTSWLLCDGSVISRTTYAALFTAISTTYGVGDGSTTFNLPDMRGRVVAGKDDMGGTSANRLTTPINGDILAAVGGVEYVDISHNHNATLTATGINGSNHTHSSIVRGSGVSDGQSADHAHNYNDRNLTSGSTAQTIVQPTIILNYIIKT